MMAMIAAAGGECRPAGEDGALIVAGANRVADAHRACRRQPERHHERQRRDVQRDLVRPRRDGIELAGERRRGGKHAHLQRHLRRGWKAKRDEPLDAGEVQRPRYVRLSIEPPPVLERNRD
jgi:hypothetical protein